MRGVAMRAKEKLVEELYFAAYPLLDDGGYRVRYYLMGECLGDWPDDGQRRTSDVIGAIRTKFGLGLREAKAIWDGREIEC
jgi:hypothetical protein